MKFQNPTIHRSKVNGRTHRQTDRQTDKPKAICPFNFFKVGGIKITPNTHKNENGLTQMIRMGKSTRQIWFKQRRISLLQWQSGIPSVNIYLQRYMSDILGIINGKMRQLRRGIVDQKGRQNTCSIMYVPDLLDQLTSLHSLHFDTSFHFRKTF